MTLEEENKELKEALQWYVDTDETYEGGEWEETNKYWLDGKRRAQLLLNTPLIKFRRNLI